MSVNEIRDCISENYYKGIRFYFSMKHHTKIFVVACKIYNCLLLN